MLDPDDLPDIDPHEKTARFIADRKHLNRSVDPPVVKPNAYMPRENEEGVSVTRLVAISTDEIWSIGHAIAQRRDPPRTLHGRGDVLVATFLGQGLNVEPRPIEGNPNHADATGWPALESDQLMIAKEIVAVAKFVRAPASEAG